MLQNGEQLDIGYGMPRNRTIFDILYKRVQNLVNVSIQDESSVYLWHASGISDKICSLRLLDTTFSIVRNTVFGLVRLRQTSRVMIWNQLSRRISLDPLSFNAKNLNDPSFPRLVFLPCFVAEGRDAGGTLPHLTAAKPDATYVWLIYWEVGAIRLSDKRRALAKRGTKYVT